MKFKVGDKVRVREDLEVDKRYGGQPFVNGMEDARGNVYRVLEAHSFGVYTLSNRLLLAEEMLEPIEDPLAVKVVERNNKPGKEHDPIKPSHYRKGEIDLYESWYRTYPFNEFRAIMSAIAERYMKRDKNDRIEDIEKARYTLERLKEYEEMREEG